MADEIGFSGPGSPNISNPTSGGAKVAIPTFFVRDGKVPEDEISLETVETNREEAARKDALQDNTQSGAPKL